jgi:hypothetical protein
MSHLVRHVLPTPQTSWVDTNLGQEQEDSSQEVSQGLVVNNSLPANKHHRRHQLDHPYESTVVY